MSGRFVGLPLPPDRELDSLLLFGIEPDDITQEVVDRILHHHAESHRLFLQERNREGALMALGFFRGAQRMANEDPRGFTVLKSIKAYMQR